MSNNSQLEMQSWQQSCMPIYLNHAAMTSDPVERMKLFITQGLAQQYYDFELAKPLNPILGETFQMTGQDGSKIYLEQTSHHPPRSHWVIDGPNNSYTFTGHGSFDIKSGPRTADVIITGHKKIVFKDGQTIKCSLTDNKLWNIFVGTLSWQSVGKQTFEDEANGIKAYIKFDAYRFKKQDFIQGEIEKDGKKICSIEGNYMGYVDFDGVRYWDLRDEAQFPKHFKPDLAEANPLPSDSTKRLDRMFLRELDYDTAQNEKENLEELQRKDRKLRETCEKRRANGGPKFANI